MAQETMTPEERMMAAIRLEKPDRVPVAPLMCTPAAGKLLGLKAEEIMTGGFEGQLEAEMKVFEAFGGGMPRLRSIAWIRPALWD